MANEKRLIDAVRLREVLDRYVNAPHVTMFNTYSKGMRIAIDTCIELLESQRTVDAVEVPCKMGDTVWGIKKYNHGQAAKQGVVHQMFFGDDMRLCICVKNVCRGEWGKNVFTTKEEAETAVRELGGAK